MVSERCRPWFSPRVWTFETPFGGVNGSVGVTEELEAFLRAKFVTEMGV